MALISGWICRRTIWALAGENARERTRIETPAAGNEVLLSKPRGTAGAQTPARRAQVDASSGFARFLVSAGTLDVFERRRRAWRVATEKMEALRLGSELDEEFYDLAERADRLSKSRLK
jgi:hypothetical protein